MTAHPPYLSCLQDACLGWMLDPSAAFRHLARQKGEGTVIMRYLMGLAVLTFCAPLLAQDTAVPVQPAPHVSSWPSLGTGKTAGMRAASLALGPEMQRGRSARDMLAEQRKLDAAFTALKPQRAGKVDAYVVTVALDSDPVFSREARETGRVLSRRYGAEGRTITLAGPDGNSADLPRGSISALILTLARVAEVMDPAEDVLVLYSTSHGYDQGLTYHDGDMGYGILSPFRLKSVLEELGFKRRILFISACYSGIFVPSLATPDTAIVTAASADKSSFGCMADNDWTYFGDALVNNALRKPSGLPDAANEARATIAGWEAQGGLPPSDPQVVIGAGVGQWLPQLEASIPKLATAPVGKPSARFPSGPSVPAIGGR